MSTKSRGSNAERDIIHKFWASGWGALRSAGSGSTSHPAPDVLASNNLRTLAIECKLTTAKSKYFSKQEVQELQLFADKFGAEPWLAVKFFRTEWYFFPAADSPQTGAHIVITQDYAKSFGITFDDLLE